MQKQRYILRIGRDGRIESTINLLKSFTSTAEIALKKREMLSEAKHNAIMKRRERTLMIQGVPSSLHLLP